MTTTQPPTQAPTTQPPITLPTTPGVPSISDDLADTLNILRDSIMEFIILLKSCQGICSSIRTSDLGMNIDSAFQRNLLFLLGIYNKMFDGTQRFIQICGDVSGSKGTLVVFGGSSGLPNTFPTLSQGHQTSNGGVVSKTFPSDDQLDSLGEIIDYISFKCNTITTNIKACATHAISDVEPSSIKFLGNLGYINRQILHLIQCMHIQYNRVQSDGGGIVLFTEITADNNSVKGLDELLTFSDV